MQVFRGTKSSMEVIKAYEDGANRVNEISYGGPRGAVAWDGSLCEASMQGVTEAKMGTVT